MPEIPPSETVLFAQRTAGDRPTTPLAESLIPMTVDWRNVGRVLTELSAIRKGRTDREKDSRSFRTEEGDDAVIDSCD